MSTWDGAASWDAEDVSWDGERIEPERRRIHLLPDIERVLVGFLLDQPELTGLIDDRVYTSLPGRPDWPAVRVLRWGGTPPFSRPLWLDAANVQVEVWGGTKAEASEVARWVRALLAARLIWERPFVTALVMGPVSDMPDESFVPAKPRFRLDFQVLFHPGPDAPDRSTRRPAALAASTT